MFIIKNDRQLGMTKHHIAQFEQALEELERNPNLELHPRLIQAQKDSINSTLEDLHEQVERYSAIQSGRLQRLKLESIEDVGRALIEARIAERLTHKELAARLHVAEQQIQRDEANEYASASLSRLQEVASALGVTFHAQLQIQRSRKKNGSRATV